MNEVRSVAVAYAKGFGIEGCGASGILINDNWVISHGSLLNAKVTSNARLREFFDLLETGQLTSLPGKIQDDLKLLVFQQQYKKYEPSLKVQSTENDKSVELGRSNLVENEGLIVTAWKCPLLQNTFRELLYSWNFDKSRNIDRSLLSIFLMISLNKSAAADADKISRAIEALTQFVGSCTPSLEIPARASLVEVSSTPFGNPVFIDSISRGIVSNVLGDAGCLMLTDANAVPGSEGAPVYVTRRNGTRRNICGMVIAPLSWCRGEWVDYTFAASLLPCLRRLLFSSNINDLQQQQHDKSSSFLNANEELFNESDTRIADLLDKSLVLVRCGSGWGTGIIVDVRTGTIITCAHVVHKAPESRIKVVLRRDNDTLSSGSSGQSSSSSSWAKLVYRTTRGKPYDVAVLRIDPREIEPTRRSITIDDVRPVLRGEAVGSAGFPFFSSHFPTLTRGNVSATSECMLQTTCCIQSGSSGGPIVRWSTGEMLGMVVCNAISTSKSKLYPRLNMAVPVSILKVPLSEYLRTGQTKVLEALDTDDPIVRKTWNFQHPLSSKI